MTMIHWDYFIRGVCSIFPRYMRTVYMPTGRAWFEGRAVWYTLQNIRKCRFRCPFNISAFAVGNKNKLHSIGKDTN